MAEEMKKEDRRVRRTRKILTQALTELLQQKQVNEITVKELTDLADMNRGTFYLYYKDIYDMLERIEDNLFNALNEILERHEKENMVEQSVPILVELLDAPRKTSVSGRIMSAAAGKTDAARCSWRPCRRSRSAKRRSHWAAGAVRRISRPENRPRNCSVCWSTVRRDNT